MKGYDDFSSPFPVPGASLAEEDVSDETQMKQGGWHVYGQVYNDKFSDETLRAFLHHPESYQIIFPPIMKAISTTTFFPLSVATSGKISKAMEQASTKIQAYGLKQIKTVFGEQPEHHSQLPLRGQRLCKKEVGETVGSFVRMRSARHRRVVPLGFTTKPTEPARQSGNQTVGLLGRARSARHRRVIPLGFTTKPTSQI